MSEVELARSFWDFVALVADPAHALDRCAAHPVYDVLRAAVLSFPERGFRIRARLLFDPWDEPLLPAAFVRATRQLDAHQEMSLATQDLTLRFNNMDALFWGLRHLMHAVCAERPPGSDRARASLATLEAAIRRIEGRIRADDLADAFQMRL